MDACGGGAPARDGLLRRPTRTRVDGRALLLASVIALTGCGRDKSAGSPPAPGQVTYQRFCISCHASGVNGAPMVGNAQAWVARIAQGEPVLLRHTIEGRGSAGMPPRGMCVACTDQELAEAIRYMTSRSE